MNDLEWLRGKEKDRRSRQQEQLSQAREEASRRGKEPFDFGRLREIYDPSSDLTSTSDLPDPQTTAEALERRYYLDFPDVLTLAEFARNLEAIRPFQ